MVDNLVSLCVAGSVVKITLNLVDQSNFDSILNSIINALSGNFFIDQEYDIHDKVIDVDETDDLDAVFNLLYHSIEGVVLSCSIA